MKKFLSMWIGQNYNIDISPDDIAGFMIKYDRGVSGYYRLANII